MASKFDPELSIPSTQYRSIGTVSNLEIKKNTPSIFIASSSEAYSIADYLKAQIQTSGIFDIQTWKDEVFVGKDEHGNELSILEQLKNFTDIYDFAIFIFIGDHDINALFRKDENTNQAISAKAINPNVIFEFGLFFGRLGANYSYVLYTQEATEFVEKVFSDLKDSWDSTHLLNDDFQIRKKLISGDYLKAIETTTVNEFLSNSNISNIASDIIGDFKTRNEQTKAGFLPSTSLAFGYFDNFINPFYQIIKEDSQSSDMTVTLTDDGGNNIMVKLNTTKIIINIIEIMELSQSHRKYYDEFIKKNNLSKATLKPRNGRIISTYFLDRDLDDTDNELHFFDFPTTLSSSSRAIELTTRHSQIIELLSEKERKNFYTVVGKLIKELDMTFNNSQNLIFSFTLEIDAEKYIQSK